MEEKKKRMFGRIAYFTAISLALLLAATGWLMSRGEPCGTVPELGEKATKLFSSKKRLSEEEREKVKQEIRRIFDETRKEDLETYNSTVSRMEEQLRKGVRRAKDNIPNVIDSTCTFKQSAKICYLMAKDAADGGNELSEHLSGVIVPNIISPLQKGTAECENELARLAASLESSRTNLHARIVSAGQMPELGLERDPAIENSFKELLKTVDSSSDGITEIAKIKTMTAISIAIDAIFIRSTVACFRSVLGHIARRMGVTVASSIASAAADGPLPIGDAIAVVISVGGAAWCAYDIYKANTEMPAKIRSELWNSIERSCKDVLESGMSRAKAILEAYEKQHSQMEQKVLAEIDKEL